MRIEPTKVDDMPEEAWQEIREVAYAVHMDIDKAFTEAKTYEELDAGLIRAWKAHGLIKGIMVCNIPIVGGE